MIMKDIFIIYWIGHIDEQRNFDLLAASGH